MLRVRVTGSSMAPWVASGDVVTLQKASPNALFPGDLVLCVGEEGELLLHRLIRIGKVNGRLDWIQTHGDRLRCPDPPVPAGKILGRAVRIQRESGRRTARLDRVGWRFFGLALAIKHRTIRAAVLVLATLRRRNRRAGNE